MWAGKPVVLEAPVSVRVALLKEDYAHFLHDPALIEMGRLPLQLTALMIVLDAAAHAFPAAKVSACQQRACSARTIAAPNISTSANAWRAVEAAGVREVSRSRCRQKASTRSSQAPNAAA